MKRPEPKTPASFTRSRLNSIAPCTPLRSYDIIDATVVEILADDQSPMWKYLKNPLESIKTIEGTDDILK
jgi:hypothetical protein